MYLTEWVYSIRLTVRTTCVKHNVGKLMFNIWLVEQSSSRKSSDKGDYDVHWLLINFVIYFQLFKSFESNFIAL